MNDSEDPNGRRGDLNAPPKNKKLLYASIAAGVLFAVTFIYIIGYFLVAPPPSFNTSEVLEIRSGMTVKETGNYLSQKMVIRSPFVFNSLVWLIGGDGGVIAGKYKFEKPISVFEVVGRVTTNGYGVTVIKITIPEGLSNRQIASLLSKNIDGFDKEKFLSLAQDKEGYLFPDTYFFEPEAKPEHIIETMTENFDRKIKNISMDIGFSGKKLKELLTMASILEEEARTEETRKKIADILWRRIDKGMPLQVDASFVYIMGKGSADLSLEDLKIDSPYNTYKYKGLPPGPITNPGLDAILAAIHPISNPYWFYLSDKEGNMHYAKTFDEHKANKAKYLR